jgi:hypothetical protein
LVIHGRRIFLFIHKKSFNIMFYAFLTINDRF